jgi:hypothetical protein
MCAEDSPHPRQILALLEIIRVLAHVGGVWRRLEDGCWLPVNLDERGVDANGRRDHFADSDIAGAGDGRSNAYLFEQIAHRLAVLVAVTRGHESVAGMLARGVR